MKLVINKCYGGFSLSYAGVMAYAKLAGLKLNAYVNARRANGLINFDEMEKYEGEGEAFLVHYSEAELNPDGTLPDDGYFSDREIRRDDPHLIAVVKKLGKKANGSCADLKIITIPDGTKWQVEEYDGREHIAEQHETWG